MEAPVNSYCNFPDRQVFVTVDGYVKPCCYWIGPTGNMAEHSAVSLWNGFARARRLFQTGSVPSECAICPAIYRRHLRGSELHTEESGELECGSEVLQTWPAIVTVDPCTNCDGRCRFCLVVPEQRGYVMTSAMFTRLLPLVHKGTQAIMAGSGEPLLHPCIIDFLRALSRLGADVWISTNGMPVQYYGMKELQREGLDKVTFSVGGMEDAYHRWIQPGVEPARVWEFFAEAGRLSMKLVGAYLMTKDNIQDAPAFARKIVSLGATEMSLMQLIQQPTGPMVEDTLDHADRVLVDASIREATQIAVEAGLFVAACYNASELLI